jgi:hypothetical protein
VISGNLLGYREIGFGQRITRSVSTWPRAITWGHEKRALFVSHAFARWREGARQRHSHPARRLHSRRGHLFLVDRLLHLRQRLLEGDLRTNQHTPLSDPYVRSLSSGREVASGFSGTFVGDQAKVFGTSLLAPGAQVFAPH